MCSQYRRRICYRASRSSVDTLSICTTRKRRSAACTSQNVLSCALYTSIELGTGHLVFQCTQCPLALPVSVGLLLAMTETYCYVLSIRELNLVQGISFVIRHTLHMMYLKKLFCCLNNQECAVMCSRYRSRTWYSASRSSEDTVSICSTSKRTSAA
jgi:hypothetical protein